MMTATSHNRILGILHLAYGGLILLLMIAFSIFMLVMMGVIATNNNSDDLIEGGIFALVMMFVIAINLLLITPSFLAGYALLKRKRWAKTMGMIAAIAAGLNFPLGTALCVYTLWFLFGEGGRFLYHKAAYALPSGDASWARAASREPEREYIPPSAPPDWR
ncbi:MAG: hypothetical protein H0V18_13240 [Pyrinomonadaceae bacterium]|nr:hypothetical protein [Pyrinomonadaceae bacterium]